MYIKPIESEISELTTEMIHIYPNPFTSFIHIQNSTAKTIYVVNIFNNLGILIRSYNFAGEQNTIDLQNLQSGIYFLVIESDVKITKKLIKY